MEERTNERMKEKRKACIEGIRKSMEERKKGLYRGNEERKKSMDEKKDRYGGKKNLEERNKYMEEKKK